MIIHVLRRVLSLFSRPFLFAPPPVVCFIISRGKAAPVKNLVSFMCFFVVFFEAISGSRFSRVIATFFLFSFFFGGGASFGFVLYIWFVFFSNSPSGTLSKKNAGCLCCPVFGESSEPAFGTETRLYRLCCCVFLIWLFFAYGYGYFPY